MDELIAVKCNASFNPTDVPRQAFFTAGVAWLEVVSRLVV
jgi:hypothetical protein